MHVCSLPFFFIYFFFFSVGKVRYTYKDMQRQTTVGQTLTTREALARQQGIWSSERHERSQEPVGNRRWGQRKVNVNATGRGPKLTARRLGGDKQSTQPGDVHPGLDTSRAARRLRNNCSRKYERKPVFQGNNTGNTWF